MPWILKAQPYDEALPGLRTVYFSDVGLLTEPGDTPGDTYYERRLEIPLDVIHSLVNGTALGGDSSSSYGPVKLVNLDGVLDYLDDFEWGHRFVELGFTEIESPTLADFGTVFAGVAEGYTPGDAPQIALASLDALFDKPFKLGTFGGTGGVDGGADLKDVAFPIALGIVRQITPVLIDATHNIYMISHPGMHALLAARDMGDPFASPGASVANYAALVAASMAGVDYRLTNTAPALIRLATAPAGKFTCDVQGLEVGGSWISSCADLTSWIVQNMTVLTSGDLDAASFAALAGACPQKLAYWFDGTGSDTVRGVIDLLRNSVGANLLFDDTRKLTLLPPFAGPAVTADFAFDGRTIVDLDPMPVEKRLGRQTLRYRRYWTTIAANASEMAATVGASDRASFPQAWRSESYVDAPTQTACLDFGDETDDTALDEQADAQAEAVRRVTVGKVKRKGFSLSNELTPGLAVGQTIALTDDRYGLAAGRNVYVLEVHADTTQLPELHRCKVIG